MSYYSSLGSFYRSKEWSDFRFYLIAKRQNENNEIICEHCHKPITKLYDVILHHKKELTLDNVNDVSVSLNEDNIMIVHNACHNEIHSRWGRYTRHKYLVCGGDREQRLNYINSASVSGDLLVEVVEIKKMITLGANDSDRCLDNVFAVRNLLLDCVKYNRGKWVNAWICGEYKYLGERERIANELEAEIIDLNCLNTPVSNVFNNDERTVE